MKPLVFLTAGALCSCAVGPDFHAPPAPDVQSYTRAAGPAAPVAAAGAAEPVQRFVTAAHATPGWWKQFRSDALNRLVDTALQRSPTLAQARARLLEAQEDYRAQAGASGWPTVDAALSAERQKVNLGAVGISSLPSPGPFTLYDASVSVTYLFDVFGGNRRSLEAMMAQVDYQAFELQAARLTLAGNVVSTAIRRASLQRQIALTQRLLEAQAQQLAITEGRFAAGGVAELDVRKERTLLAQTRASLPALAQQLALARHRLAILLGVAPPKADFEAVTLDSLYLPDTVPVTLPSTLARERPDILASEALLHQASANVGVATANLYPRFAISAGVGSERIRVGDIVRGLNVWNAGLDLTQPIFHGGELRAKRRAAQSAYAAALAGYRQTVLEALQQVADTLEAVENDACELEARNDAALQAQASLHIARGRYAAGGVSQFGLLDSQRQVLQAALDATRARTDRFTDTAALFQSLGGQAFAGDPQR